MIVNVELDVELGKFGECWQVFTEIRRVRTVLHQGSKESCEKWIIDNGGELEEED